MLRVIEKEGSWYFVENSTGRKGYISNNVVRVVESRPEPKAPVQLPNGSAASESPSLKESEPPSAPPQQVPPSRVQAVNPSTPGRFGVGLYLTSALGATPSLIYDVTDRFTAVGAVRLYNGVGYGSGMMGEFLYRFRQPSKPQSNVVFEPYIGGGLMRLSVNYGEFGGSGGSSVGLVGSGGTFLTVKKIPKWRFSGDISLVSFDDMGFESIGIRLGTHYFF
jgi:hypothetical protein